LHLQTIPCIKQASTRYLTTLLKHNHDNHNHNQLTNHQYIKTYYEMTTTSKRPLISKSVTIIRIGIHTVGEEPDQHVLRVAPRVSVQQPSTKSLLGRNQTPTLRMKSWLPAIVRPSRHPRLPHSPSTKPPKSREVRFDKVVTELLGLPGPIKPNMWSIPIKACPPGPK
jgi:hypothetical protein